jgi:hypothetical protein
MFGEFYEKLRLLTILKLISVTHKDIQLVEHWKQKYLEENSEL